MLKSGHELAILNNHVYDYHCPFHFYIDNQLPAAATIVQPAAATTQPPAASFQPAASTFQPATPSSRSTDATSEPAATIS